MYGIMRRSKLDLSDNPPRCPTTRSKVGAQSRDGVVLRQVAMVQMDRVFDGTATTQETSRLSQGWTEALECDLFR